MQADSAQDATQSPPPSEAAAAGDSFAPESLTRETTQQPSDGPHSPFPSWAPGGLAAAGLVILIVTLVRASRRRAARRPREQPGPRERLATLRSEAGQRDQLMNLMVDVEELTRRFAAQLDNKAARLEILLAEADEMIRRLEAAGAGAPASRARVGTNARATAAAAGSPDADDVADPITREVYRLADEGCSPMEIARRLEQHTGKVELILALRNV